MGSMGQTVPGFARNEVTTSSEGVVVSIWRGPQSVATVHATNEEIRVHLQALQSQYKTFNGIPKAQQSKIFDKMFRADNVQKMAIEGTGLGLYIVKESVKRMGGMVWFESIERVGTTFYVVLPYAVPPYTGDRSAKG